MKRITKRNIQKQNILSLDAASHHTGFAIYSNGRIIQSGTWHLNPNEWQTELYNRIQNAFNQYQITYVIAEDIFYSVPKNASKKERAIRQNIYKVLLECHNIIQTICKNNEIPVSFIKPLEVKKRFLGSFNTWKCNRTQLKAKTIQKVLSYGYELENTSSDDESDAISFLIVELADKITHPNSH